MANNSGHSVGLTPLMMRLASQYVLKGVGTYEVDLYGYDSVEVYTVRTWGNYGRRRDTDAYQMITRVDFKKKKKTVRWIEFSSVVAGAGGAPTLHISEEEE